MSEPTVIPADHPAYAMAQALGLDTALLVFAKLVDVQLAKIKLYPADALEQALCAVLAQHRDASLAQLKIVCNDLNLLNFVRGLATTMPVTKAGAVLGAVGDGARVEIKHG